jgi:hypothetical protein
MGTAGVGNREREKGRRGEGGKDRKGEGEKGRRGEGDLIGGEKIN